VKVEVFNVAGFIGLLNVALMIELFGQTPVLAVGGVTAVTVGGAIGLPGLIAMFASGSPHPAITTNRANDHNHFLFSLRLCICFSSFFVAENTRAY
jgi:hypothetical protein